MTVMLDDADGHSSFRKCVDQPFNQMSFSAVFHSADTKKQGTPEGMVILWCIDVAKIFPVKTAGADIYILGPDTGKQL